MRQVRDDVKKGDIAPVYLIYGDEAYLRENYKNTLINALVTPGDNLNFNSFRGSNTDPKEITALAVTMPFMAEKRVILVQDSGFFKKATEEMEEYIDNPSSDTVLVFVESGIDKRNKAYSIAKKHDYLVEAQRFDPEKLPQWITVNFKRKGKKIPGSAIKLLIERAGTDLSLLDQEVEKLASFAGDREIITDEDVLTMVHRSPSASVFTMIDAIVDNKLDTAVGLYYDMLSGDEKALGILALIVRHFRILLIVKEMNDKKAAQADIGKAAGVYPSMVWKYNKQAKVYSRAKMKNILKDCLQTERDIKQGVMGENLAVEILLIKIAEGDSNKNGRN
ncbi:MAG: DNA polymerase III subunit delta [Lachnospiraceae bacterium]|nr:DNA polymerase III subunit delta [Lachnospiraceae bacterium]